MSRFFSVALAVAFSLSFAAVGFGPAAAQATAANETATATATNTSSSVNATANRTPISTVATATPDATGTERGPDVDVSVGGDDSGPTETPTEAPVDNASGTPIDEHVTLLDWRFSQGTFTLVFENSHPRPATVTLTEATQPGEGAQQFAVREERLLKGQTTLTMTTQISGGEAAVSITTPDSIAAGSGIVISTGAQGANPFDPFGGTSGVLSGVGLAIVMSGAAAGWVLWNEETGVMEA